MFLIVCVWGGGGVGDNCNDVCVWGGGVGDNCNDVCVGG